MQLRSPQAMIAQRHPGVLLVTPWYGGNAGGVAVMTESLTHALLDAGVECVVLEMRPDGIFPQVRRGIHGERIVSVCVRGSAAAGSVKARVGERTRRGILALVLAWLTRRFRLRVAHFHYVAASYDAVMPSVMHLGLSAVVTFHGSDVNFGFADPATASTLMRLVCDARAVVAVSAELAGVVTSQVPNAVWKTYIIHNAASPAFVAAARVTVPAPARDIDVLYVGNLLPVKGPDILVEAFARLLVMRPGSTMSIAGSGPLQEELEATTARFGIAKSVAFLGRIDRADITALYARARVLVMPSRAEGLSLVAVEAQFMGVPVVATAVGGLPEVIEDGVTGVLVPPDDPDAMARTIAALLDDEGRRARLADQAMARAAELFAPSRMVDAYVQLYQAAVLPNPKLLT